MDTRHQMNAKARMNLDIGSVTHNLPTRITHNDRPHRSHRSRFFVSVFIAIGMSWTAFPMTPAGHFSHSEMAFGPTGTLETA